MRKDTRDQLSRRRFLAASGASLTVGPLQLRSAVAQKPAASTIAVGEISVTVLSDGNLVMPVPFLASNAAPEALSAAVAAAGQSGERVDSPCNVTLVRTKSDVILIDTGSGPHYMPTAGKLLANIEAAGINRESITKVVFTHAHADHIWGTLDDFDDSPNFPNATYVIAAAEWNFWMSDDAASKLPPERQNFAPGAKRNLSRIKDGTKRIKPGEDVASGLRAVDTAGHTAGHIAIEITSGKDAMLVVGDALMHPVIAFAHPEWRPAADHHDAEQAVGVRKTLLDRLATDRTPIVGFHLPFPGHGTVERAASAYRYVPGGR